LQNLIFFNEIFCRQNAYPGPTIRTVGKTSLCSANNYSSSSRSVLNNTGLPPSFRTFHSNQQNIPAFYPMYRPQVSFPMNHPWSNMAANEQVVGVMMNNNDFHVEQQRGARNRARSVDPRPRNNPPFRQFNIPQKPVAVGEHYHRHRSHPTNNVGPSVEDVQEQNVPSV
jgi:hypothetical protein